MSLPDQPNPSLATEFLVICLCAAWCGTCREYQPGFTALAAQFPDAKFVWLDIEDHAEQLGDLDIENFPTLLIKRRESVLFYGVMLPHLSHLRRTLETFQEQSAEQSRDDARSNPVRRAWQADEDLQRLGKNLENCLDDVLR